MSTMDTINQKTEELADRRKVLAHRVQLLQDEIEALKRRYLPGIKAAADDVAVAQGSLHEHVKAAPHLFEKPKTQVLHGFRVGFKKEKGKLLLEDEKATIRLIKRVVPDQAETLIEVREKVLKTPLAQLPAAVLKRLAVTITDDHDEVYIKPIGDDIDRLVLALLEEGEKILREAS